MVLTMTDFTREREAMVEQQLRGRGIGEPHILDAFRAVSREEFVPATHAHLAYGDHPLPIEAEQTISQPYIVALMIQAAGIGPGDTVLEVGAGSVVAMERQPELVELARARLRRLRFDNVEIIEGDGTRGCAERAPFDAILVAASGSHAPESLIAQLAPGGRLVMPIGDPHGAQELIKVTKQDDLVLRQESLGGVRFVPLIGEEGWNDA